MSKFVTKRVEGVEGKKIYEQLVILPDQTDLGKVNLDNVDGIWDEYEKSLEERYRGSLRGLLSIMNRDAKMQPLADGKKFRDVTPDGELIKEYEIKYQDLRAYAIKIPYGKLVLLGGYKNDQKRDFVQFRSIKKRYLESLKLQNRK